MDENVRKKVAEKKLNEVLLEVISGWMRMVSVCMIHVEQIVNKTSEGRPGQHADYAAGLLALLAWKSNVAKWPSAYLACFLVPFFVMSVTW